MNYRIYKMVGKDRYEPDGYSMKTVTSIKLEETDSFDEFESVEKAMLHIKENATRHANEFAGNRLTILPVISVGYDGEISD